MKASKLTARSLAYALRAVGRKVAKARREAQTPHGKQSVKKLMAHGAATSSIEVDAPKVFDRVARKYGIDYSLKKAEKEGKTEYLVFFKAKDVDVMTAAFKEYTGVSLKKEQRKSIRKKLEQAKERVAKHREITKEKTKDRGQVR